MKAAGLAGVSRRKGTRTTFRDERVRPACDLVDRNFHADEPNQLWVADITPASVLCSGGLVGWNRCTPRDLVHQGAPRVMQVRLHANATTTPKVRAYIQQSTAPVSVLAAELGVSEQTIRRWRGRSSVLDRSHAPMRPTSRLSPLEERLICELRSELALPLDDITEVMRRCVRDTISRSGVHRCLVRNGLNRKPRPEPPEVGVFENVTIGFIHADLKHLTSLCGHKSYVFVARDRATRFVHVEVTKSRSATTIAACLERFLDAFAYPVHVILTDNGSEFTDRFAVDMKDKPEGKPSGRHPFDRVCAARAIEHRLIKPFTPKTNGMVERFNRRLAEALRNAPPASRNAGKNRFATHDERNQFIHGFVHVYNRTRLRCLGYHTPLQALSNPPEHNTFAGAGSFAC
jgi:transposase InsO family protein